MSRKRILVVDDDRSILQLYRTALALAGFAVETAEDGFGALQKIDVEPPHLIVLDLHMPCIDGLSVLSELRANSSTLDIPVVVVTGTECESESAVTQASVILRKPCQPDKLISEIEHQLSSAAA
jgi:two-component system, sensor histidine kinase and response regulator